MAKTALVTGFSSNLGKHISQSLVDAGYVVYAGGRKINGVTIPSKKINLLELDITSDASCTAAVAQIAKESKRLDVLINVAGMTLTGPFDSFTAKVFLGMLDINVVGAFRLTKAAIPIMSSGYIINISSLSGFMSSPNYALYSASKHALQAWAWAAAVELHPKNIHLVSLATGALLGSSISPMSHKPARQAIPFLAKLLPLTSPSQVAERIITIINDPSPAPLILIGRDSQVMYIIQKIVPSSIWFGIQNWLWQKQQ